MELDYIEKVKNEFENSSFWKFIGLKAFEVKEGYVSLMLPVKDSFINVRESVHGGIYASILDTTMGMTAKSLGYKEVATLQLNIQYFQSVNEGQLITESNVINQGRNSIFVEAKLMNEANLLLAHSTGTFKVSRG